MKLQTAIVEDQKPDAERLAQLLKKAFGEEEILCRRFVCGDDFLKEFPGEGYQVVFLDICMAGINGIETARRLRQADPEVLIVFVTSSPEYVWDAFPVHLLHRVRVEQQFSSARHRAGLCRDGGTQTQRQSALGDRGANLPGECSVKSVTTGRPT